ncbi:hypothetical protein ES332_A05G446100v1 [Gossypium tomentosum]|uniref:NB-ARC domain-containing protein n=1 Tax=Gossypium tomentosum TaxID=34277 RepID=A0A5D2QSH0_GOSTO|nr:hypothetical protein ES332_A05G446100v1 [Gossypium tomentosum]TYI31360.1 hypothetical protein ES332_A05G446100v1 [Gossypium tomentosum]
MIKAFLQDAEEKQTKNTSVKLWLERVEDVAYKAVDVLDEFAYEILRRKVEIRNQILRKVLDFLSCNNSILFRLKMANKIKDILTSLDDLNNLASQFGLQQRAIDHITPVTAYGGPKVETISSRGDSNIVGRKHDVSKVVNLLVNPKDMQVVSVVPIVGMAGLGKTTLAKLVYDDLNVQRHFVRFWVCVSDHFDVKRILKEMLEHFTDDPISIPQNKNAMVEKLKQKIEGAKEGKDQIKYLLVLDDVWDVTEWEDLKLCLEGISINGGNGVIVTTRKEDVASTVQARSDQWHQPEKLEDEECWSIIKERTLRDSPISHGLEPIGKEIAKQCQGVPLVANVIGGLMSKIELSPRAWLEIQRSGVWGSPESVLKVERVLKLSFDRLSSPSLKKCFAYSAMFPKDYCFKKEELIQLWMAEGFLGTSMAMVDNEIDLFKKLSKSFKFKRLRVLKLVGTSYIFEFPDFLGELKHLRYLDISGTRIRALPKSSTKLYHLQTLRLLGSVILTFPDVLENLISLKHLYFDTQDVQPDNIGNLTCFQTLPVFYVGLERGHSIKELGSLNELRGELEIRRLQCVRNKQEANGANLHLKEKLCKLIFDFKWSSSYNSEEVMEGLQPHSKLQSLTVNGYGGNSFPSWMLRPVGDSGLFLLNNLLELELFRCHNCESLPPLGQLQNLQFLNLRNLREVKGMGSEFYCNKGIDDMNKTIMFPCLEELNIWSCPNLSSIPELKGFSSLQNLSIESCAELEVISITGGCSSLEKLSILFCKKLSKIGDGLSSCTCLKELGLYGCPNLSSIPELKEFSSLQNLSIGRCNELEVIPITGGRSSIEKLNIHLCEKLSKIGDGLSTSTCLKELDLYGCPNLSSIPELKGFSSLQNLSIGRCNELEVFPMTGGCSSLEKLNIHLCEKLSKIGDGLSTSTCLKELDLYGCPNLSSIPELKGFSSLQSLSIERCNELEVFPITGGCLSLEKLNIHLCEKLSKIGDGLSSCTCLKELDLYSCPNLSSIPDLKGFSSLQNLSIEMCNELEVIPITGGCSSLEKLNIHLCEKLRKIRDRLSTSTCLKELDIYGCPNLSSIPELKGFSSLQNLSIGRCNELEVFPMTGGCSSLEKLNIHLCEKLSKIGDRLSTSTCLKELDLYGCPNLIGSFPITGGCLSLEKLNIHLCEKLSKIGDGLSTSTCLKELDLYSCPNLSSIPDLKGFSSLQNLSIEMCNELEVIPITGGCSSLEKLNIHLCKKLSKIGDGLSTSTCLKELDLYGCPNLSSIPELKGFSSLQNLSIERCAELEVISITGGCSSLEKLNIHLCRKLSKIGDGLSTSTCLKELDLYGCPNLSSIPELKGFSSLQNLSIETCNELEVFPITGRCSSLKKVNISRCKKLSKIGDGLSTSTYLKYLHLYDCPNLKPIPSLDGLSSLTELKLDNVGEGWSCLLPNMFRSNTSLRSLRILNLPDLIWIPDDSLGRLNCLGELTIGGFSEELQEFPFLSSIQYLSASLRVLKLIGWEKLKSLSPQLQFLTALEALTIKEFQGIEALPEWLGNLSSLRFLNLSGFEKLKSLPHQLQLLTALKVLIMSGFHKIEALPERLGNLSSLRRLHIDSCNKLMYLPSVDVMRSLSKLNEISIADCPQFETKSELSKISHIPRIYINYQRFGYSLIP